MFCEHLGAFFAELVEAPALYDAEDALLLIAVKILSVCREAALGPGMRTLHGFALLPTRGAGRERIKFPSNAKMISAPRPCWISIERSGGEAVQ